MPRFFWVLILVATSLFLFQFAHAAGDYCGDTDESGVTDTVCTCGDLVYGAPDYTYTLTGNLSCTGHGLIVGTDAGVVIDGGGFSISGDGGEDDHGIDINLGTTADVTIQNFSNISNFGTGISVFETPGVTLDDNTLTSNRIGISISDSPSSVLTSNLISGSEWYNLRVIGTEASFYDLDIDSTNKVEGKSVYYLYNQSGTENDPLVYNSDVGMFWCISCNYVQLKNVTLASNNFYGVFLNNTDNSLIQNVVANSNFQSGISLLDSDSNQLLNNTTNFNRYGIELDTSNANTVTGNTANYNGYGYRSTNSNTVSGNNFNYNIQGVLISGVDTFSGNTLLNNTVDLSGANGSYSSNLLYHNATSSTLSLSEPQRIYEVGDTVSFNSSLFNPNGTACNDCTVSVSVSPAESTLSWGKSGNQITGSFQATREGYYTLNLTITNSGADVTKKNIAFLVGDQEDSSVRYYLKRGWSTSYGKNKGTGNDSQILSFTPPSEEESWYCSAWVENSPDELPTYPLSYLTSISLQGRYKQSAESGGLIGVQRYGTYDATVDSSSSIAAAADYTSVTSDFTNLNWLMDYPFAWYRLTLKLNGTYPYWQTSAADPSYADFDYQYSATPAVKTISNANVNVLSATAAATDAEAAKIELENYNSTATSTTLTLTGFDRPFENATSTIYSTGTTTVMALVSANATTSLDAVPLDLTLDAGNLAVKINTWDEATNYFRWTETGSGVASTSHTLSELDVGASYLVAYYKDDATTTVGTLVADANGELAFDYNSGYSDIIFTVDGPDPVVPEETPTPTPAPVILSSGTRHPKPASQLTPDEIQTKLESLKTQLRAAILQLIELLTLEIEKLKKAG